MFGPLHCPTLRINLDRVLSMTPGLEKVSLHPGISSLQDGFTLASLAYFPLPLRALSLHDDLWPSLSRERNREKIEVDSPSPSLLSPTLPSSSPSWFRSPDFPMYFSCLSVASPPSSPLPARGPSPPQPHWHVGWRAGATIKSCT